MKLNILGSGGAMPFPRALCQCANCEQAREQGVPYARTGPSMYIPEDGGILFDTPEEIRFQFERDGIKELKHIFFTHWHPDHTQGMRIIENINHVYAHEQRKSPINVWLPKTKEDDFKKYCAMLWYFESQGWAVIRIVDDRLPIKLNKVTVTPVNFNRKDRDRYGFVIEKDDKRVMYAPCSTFGLEVDGHYHNLDCLIMELGWPGETAKIRESLTAPHPWLDHVSFEENIDLIKLVQPKQSILTHVDGTRHRCNDGNHDVWVKAVRKTCLNLEIAYDGMKITI
jgi:phosphoribosyl 1,2-cyclic phosphate phosphodiesterase